MSTAVSRCVIGTWPISGDLGFVALADIERLLLHCYELGFREFDTASGYGDGFSEFVLGKVFARKDDVIINTKVGNIPFGGKDFSIAALKKSFDESRKRLGRDAVNTLFLHNPRAENMDYRAMLDFLAELKDQKKISSTAISLARDFDYDPYCQISDFDAFMFETNLLSMKTILEPHPSSTRLFAHSPLATGLLGGHINAQTVFPDDDDRSHWLVGARLQSIVKRIERIKQVSDLRLASLARRFLFSHENVDAIVFGVKRPDHVDDIVADLTEKPLDANLMKALEDLYKSDFGLVGEEHLSY